MKASFLWKNTGFSCVKWRLSFVTGGSFYCYRKTFLAFGILPVRSTLSTIWLCNMFGIRAFSIIRHHQFSKKKWCHILLEIYFSVSRRICSVPITNCVKAYAGRSGCPQKWCWGTRFCLTGFLRVVLLLRRIDLLQMRKVPYYDNKYFKTLNSLPKPLNIQIL